MRSRKQTIAIILSKYKKRNGAQKRDTQSFPMRLAGQKHWVAPDGKQHDVSEDHLRDLQDLTGRTVNAYDVARQSGWMRGFVNAEEVNVDLSGTDPKARANAKAYIRQHWRKGMTITMDMSDASGNLTYWKRHDKPLTAYADLAQDVPLDTSTSFSMSTPKQGLRNVINKLKAQGHKASDWRTVYRSQPSAFDDVVAKSGFMTREWNYRDEQGDNDAVDQVFTGSKRIAQAHAKLMRSSNRSHKGLPQTLYKARVLKKGLTKKSILYDSAKVGVPVVRGHEYLSPSQIPASQIRMVSKDKPKRNRKGWR